MGKIMFNGNPYGGAATVSDADHLLVEDSLGSQISAQTMIENILGDFATVETSNEASKAYSVGDYLVYGSYFYKVTQSIAQGGSILVGTNVERTNISYEVPKIKTGVASATLTSSTSASVYCPFDVPFPDANYFVTMTMPYQNYWNGLYFGISKTSPASDSPERKNADGFYMQIGNSLASSTTNITNYVDWMAIHP